MPTLAQPVERAVAHRVVAMAAAEHGPGVSQPRVSVRRTTVARWSDLVDAWRIHARIQMYVLDAVADDALAAPGPKGRPVGHQFAQSHDVRLMWLPSAAPDLPGGLVELGKDHIADRAVIRDALGRSADAIAILIERAEESGRVKGLTPTPTAFVGSPISHESYHQGDIGVRLTETGFPLDKTAAFGMWECGVR